MEPHEEYGRWRDAEDRRYAALVAGKACRDCKMCVEPGRDVGNPSRIGWCYEEEDFVYLDEPVSGKGCECFA